MARGSIVKRLSKSGQPSYYCVYRFNKRQKWEFGGHRKDEAERKLTEINSKINRNEFSVSSNSFLLSDLLAEFLLDKRDGNKLSTYLDYKNTIEQFIKPFWNDRKLRTIQREDVKVFKAWLISKPSGKDEEKKLSSQHVNKVLKHLGTIFEYAMKQGYVFNNPVKYVEKLKIPYKEALIYTPEQVSRLLKSCEEPYKTMFRMAFFTGLRPGELFALKWGDIDFKAQKIYVRRNVLFAPKEYGRKDGEKIVRFHFQAPKTKHGIRTVDISKSVVDALEGHRLNTLEKYNPLELLFFTDQGTPHDARNVIRRHFVSAHEAAGLPKIKFYEARHTYASILIELGASPKYIQRQMGHSSIMVTMDVYGHLFPSENSRITQQFDDMVLGAEKENTPSNKNLTTV